ncbi:hypothetical protein [Rhodococcus sp. NPDC058514]|uniref:hypothetical protein n=1 Tax=unclassified Rhodococcus (in: high G+C Gram-positive bacteria) TaxID=192944 RepID=UPI003659FB21
MSASRTVRRVLVAGALSVSTVGLLAVGPAAAAPNTIPFQVSPYIPLTSLPSPRLAATVGEQPGVATLSVLRTPESGNPHRAVVHWVSLATGASGSAAFPTLNAAPVTIHPGTGQVIAFVDPQAIASPGFGTFFVP